MQKDPNLFLEHILQSIGLVRDYVGNVSKDDFLKNPGLQDQVIRRIEIIGEAAKNIPEDFKNQHPEIPWRQIAGTRDFLIHEYFSVDLELTWEVVQKDLPDLEIKIRKIISQ